MVCMDIFSFASCLSFISLRLGNGSFHAYLEKVRSHLVRVWGAVQNTHLEGLEVSVKRFGEIVEEIRRKPYDLLDGSKNIFDRDFLEFNVHINDLELGVQVSAVQLSSPLHLSQSTHHQNPGSQTHHHRMGYKH